MQQLLVRFPAAVPALLPEQPAQPAQQQQQPGLTAAAAAGSAGGAVESRAAASITVALVFGREESGLLESELLLCSHACAIPTGKPRCCNWLLLLLPAAQTCLHCRWAHAASQAGLQCYRFPPFTARPLLPAPQVAVSPA
jgi:hypothetical protein